MQNALDLMPTLDNCQVKLDNKTRRITVCAVPKSKAFFRNGTKEFPSECNPVPTVQQRKTPILIIVQCHKIGRALYSVRVSHNSISQTQSTTIHIQLTVTDGGYR